VVGRVVDTVTENDLIGETEIVRDTEVVEVVVISMTRKAHLPESLLPLSVVKDNAEKAVVAATEETEETEASIEEEPEEEEEADVENIVHLVPIAEALAEEVVGELPLDQSKICGKLDFKHFRMISRVRRSTRD